MRKFFTLIIILVSLSVCTYAQTGQDILKKAVRDAKILVKEGWKPYVNMPTIERQLNNAYLRESRIIEGEPQYFIGYARRRGMNFHSAHSAAMLSARKEIVKNMESYVSSKIVIKTDADAGQRMYRSILGTANQKLGKTEPVVDIYRELKDGEFEVEVRISYERKEVGNDINEVIKKVSEQIEK